MKWHSACDRIVLGLVVTGALASCGASQGDPSGGNGSGSTNGNGNNGGIGGLGIGFGDKLKPSKDDPGQGPGSGPSDSTGCGVLTAVLRDFKDDHDDFEAYLGSQRGMIDAALDADKRPVYALAQPSLITSKTSFAQWYRDVDGVNQKVNQHIPLQETSPGVFVFESDDFFPLDDKLFGNQGRRHNYHFTTEIRGSFTYKGGEKFTFRGDDDVFVFVNGRLALDLGGVHAVETDTIDFDAKASELGIQKGKSYRLDVFHAERHTRESNFRIETSIECLFTPPPE